MDARDDPAMGGGVSVFVRALTPLLDTLIEQLVREQPACLQTFCSCLCASAPTKQFHPEGAS
jgi:hypothetical protein